MTILVSKKPDFDLTPGLLGLSSTFLENLRSVQIPGLNHFQLIVFEKKFLAAINEETFSEQREKFQDLIESRLTLLGKTMIDPSYVPELRYFLLKAFDNSLNQREPILGILDRWIDKEIISIEDALEIFELVKTCLFSSPDGDRPQLKICKSSFSQKLLSLKEHAFLRDDHIALFSKVFAAIHSSRAVDKREEFGLFLDEFLVCLERKNREIKDFYINRLKNSLILEERACTGQLLDRSSERSSIQIALSTQTQIERCTATPKCIIASARYWYARVIDEALQVRDPFSTMLDYLLDRGCISFKPLEQLWSASQELIKLWNTEMRNANGHSKITHKAEAVEFHIGPRFNKVFQSQKLPISQKMLVEIFSRFFNFPSQTYLACFIRLIKEYAQELPLDEDESIQLFKAYFDFGSGADDQFLTNLCESSVSLDALFRFDSYFNETPKPFISICSQLNQKQFFALAKGYIEGGVEELKLRLSKMNVNPKSAEKFLAVFTESE